MTSWASIRRGVALCMALFALAAPPANAQTEADFFKGKTVRVIVGFGAGNEYDLGARLLTRHLIRHIPGNPTVIVQNMPGGASVAAANFISAQAPRDGTAIGSLTRNIVTQALLGQPGLVANPREFIWLGATSFPGRLCVVGDKAPAREMKDIFVREVVMGSVAPGNSTNILPSVFNRVLGAKFKIVEGYRGTPDILLAVERGEVEGVCASNGQFRGVARQIEEGKLRVLFRAEEAAMPDFPSAPSIYDAATTEEQKAFMRFMFATTEYGRPYVLPPETPAQRVATLRKAMAAAAADPELKAEAEKSQTDMTWRAPEDLERLTETLYRTPPALIETVKQAFPNLN